MEVSLIVSPAEQIKSKRPTEHPLTLSDVSVIKCVRTDGTGCWMASRRLYQGHFHWIDHPRQIIASLQHKLFGNYKGETVDSAQLQMQLSGAEEALGQLEAREQAGKRREEEAEAKAEPRPRRARFVFPEQVEEVTEILEPAEVLAKPEAYRRIGEDVTVAARVRIQLKALASNKRRGVMSG